MRVGDLVTSHVATVLAHESIETAARRMRERHVGDLVVVEPALSGLRPIGIITDRDIAHSYCHAVPRSLLRTDDTHVNGTLAARASA